MGLSKSTIAPFAIVYLGKKKYYLTVAKRIIAMAKIVFKELTSSQNILFLVILESVN